MVAEQQDDRIVSLLVPSRPQWRFVPSIYQVGLTAVLGAVLIVALAPRLDTDFWWHLKDGGYIAARHIVPSHDFMSYTFAGRSWTDHEWLAELMLYGSYKLAGLWGPIVLFATLICLTFALVYANIVQRGVNRILALFVTTLAFIASSASWGPRIQMMSLLFLSLYALVLYRFHLYRNRRVLIVLPLLMLLWANIHGGFVLGLVLIAITLAGEWLNRRTQPEDAYSPSDLQALAITFVGTFGVTIINPNGVRQLLYPLTFILPNAYTNLIQESASPDFHMPVMMVFEAMLLLLIASVFIARPRLNWSHLFLILAFTHLAFSQVRNVPLWSVLVSPVLALYLEGAMNELKAQFPRRAPRRPRPVPRNVASILNLTLLALVCIVYLAEAAHFINRTALAKAESENYPKAAVAYMESHPLPPHVFVSYEWGGYLLWNLFPRYRDYMDSRADTLYTNKILHGYLDMYAAKPDWRSLLDKYQVQNVLVGRQIPLAQVLQRDSAWRLVYHDRLAVLYTRVRLPRR